MSFFEIGNKVIQSYNEEEKLYTEDIPIYLARAFLPNTFHFHNFLTRVKSPRELWKFSDSMQEFRVGYYGKKLNFFSEDEILLIKNISLDYSNLTKEFNRKTIPIGINHQLSSIPTIRILSQLKKKLKKPISVFEVGGGSGMLGHMCKRLNYNYTGFDNTQSFYTFVSTVYRNMYGNDFFDTIDFKQEKKNKFFNYEKYHLKLIPWWHFVNRDFPLPKSNVVVLNHCFFEIQKKALSFIFKRLAEENEGRIYLIISGWGHRLDKSDTDFYIWLEEEFKIRNEEFFGNNLINPLGTVLLSFAKNSPSYSEPLTIDQRFSYYLQDKNNLNSLPTIHNSLESEQNENLINLKNKIIKYFPKSIKKFIKMILNFVKNFKSMSKKQTKVVGNIIPRFIENKFDKKEYDKRYEDIIELIKEIEIKNGKPSYTEDESMGYYINRRDHS